MTNHVHLLLTPDQRRSGIATGHVIGRRYAQYINKTYRRTGTLWTAGQSCGCNLLLCRYIELPTTDDPAHYRWSSYHGNGCDALLTPHGILPWMATRLIARRCIGSKPFSPVMIVQTVADIRLALEQGQHWAREVSRPD